MWSTLCPRLHFYFMNSQYPIGHLCTLCILCILCIQVKIDVAQLKEQETLRMQLQQEQDLLQTFQEAQDEKLRVQHERERAALQEKVELSKRELDKEVSQQRVRERERERFWVLVTVL